MAGTQIALVGVGGFAAASVLNNWDLFRERVSEGVRSVVHHASAPSFMRGSLSSSSSLSQQQPSEKDLEMLAALSREISKLSGAVEASRTAAVRGGMYSTDGSAWRIFWLPSPRTLGTISVCVCVAGLVVWIKGLSWRDLMFASRASLDDLSTGVGERTDRVSATIEAAKESLSVRVGSMRADVQEDLSSAKEQLENDLNSTRRDVEAASQDVAALHESIMGVQGRLEIAEQQLAFTFRAIQLLCK